jgi:hypothetical protein
MNVRHVYVPLNKKHYVNILRKKARRRIDPENHSEKVGVGVLCSDSKSSKEGIREIEFVKNLLPSSVEVLEK